MIIGLGEAQASGHGRWAEMGERINMNGKRTWCHTHLPRLRAGEVDVISVKVPGQKITYTDVVSLRDAEFRVSQKGRERCLATGQRNVHAWVVGEAQADTYVPYEGLSPVHGWRRAVYDPWKGETFVDYETLRPVYAAERVVMIGKEVYYR